MLQYHSCPIWRLATGSGQREYAGAGADSEGSILVCSTLPGILTQGNSSGMSRKEGRFKQACCDGKGKGRWYSMNLKMPMSSRGGTGVLTPMPSINISMLKVGAYGRFVHLLFSITLDLSLPAYLCRCTWKNALPIIILPPPHPVLGSLTRYAPW
jgi:hypothetical protein